MSSGSLGYICIIKGFPRGHRVQSGWIRSFPPVSGVDRFIRVRLVYSGTPGRSIGSFVFVWFIRLRAAEVVRFIQVRLVDSRAPKWSSGSFTFVWCIRARPGVHLVSFASSWRVPGFVGFIHVLLVN